MKNERYLRGSLEEFAVFEERVLHAILFSARLQIAWPLKLTRGLVAEASISDERKFASRTD